MGAQHAGVDDGEKKIAATRTEVPGVESLDLVQVPLLRIVDITWDRGCEASETIQLGILHERILPESGPSHPLPWRNPGCDGGDTPSYTSDRRPGQASNHASAMTWGARRQRTTAGSAQARMRRPMLGWE